MFRSTVKMSEEEEDFFGTNDSGTRGNEVSEFLKTLGVSKKTFASCNFSIPSHFIHLFAFVFKSSKNPGTYGALQHYHTKLCL